MKNIIILIISIIPIFSFAYDWKNFGPAGVKVNNVCFDIDAQHHNVLCVSDGIFINNGCSWNKYTSNLPVWEVQVLDSANILLVM
jgi:hypothetical protein